MRPRKPSTAASNACGSSRFTTWPAPAIRDGLRLGQPRRQHLGRPQVRLVLLPHHAPAPGSRSLASWSITGGATAATRRANSARPAGSCAAIARAAACAAGSSGRRPIAVAAALLSTKAWQPARLQEAGRALDLRLPARLRLRVLEAGPGVDQQQRAHARGLAQREVQRGEPAEGEAAEHRGRRRPRPRRARARDRRPPARML